MLSFEAALATIQQTLLESKTEPPSENLRLDHAHGRVLAEDVLADRDYPPFHRSTRDGFAVRAADVARFPAILTCRGEIRAGEPSTAIVGPGECIAIMTGAPLPTGADAVVMLEYAAVEEDRVKVERPVTPGKNVVRRGSEAPSGSHVLNRGRRLGAGEIGLLASVGKAQVRVFLQPRVAILPTGDEVVPIDCQPDWFQVRNSNAFALASQVSDAGGIPHRLPVAPDEKQALRRLIEEGLESDLLLLSGGVSKGKFDYVRQVLEELDAEIFVQGVAIRPGKPLVFGRAKGKPLFGLPGNPVSTFVTFEIFVRPALRQLSGAEFEAPIFLRARLAEPLKQRLGLTAFMPARVEPRGGEPFVSLVSWQGSGDLVGIAAANCFLVIHPEQAELAAEDWVDVLPKSA